MEQHALNRRSFIAAAAAGAADIAACGIAAGTPAAQASEAAGGAAEAPEGTYPAWLGEPPVIADDQIAQTVETDIVVVGGGNAGVMCACAAAEEGATVAVLESQPQEAIWYYGLHDIASLNSNYAREQGIEDIKKSEFVSEHQGRTHNRSNPRLIAQFADKSGEMVDWPIANGPAEVADSLFLRKAPMWQTYFDEGAEVNTFKCWLGTIQYNFNAAAPTLIAAAEERGAQWFWETRSVVLLTEEAEVPMLVDGFDENGVFGQSEQPVPQITVTGVIGQNADGTYTKFLAKKGVVLAAGDFAGNAQMFEALMDERRNISQMHGLPTDNLINGMFGRDGSGIKMGLWAGGSMGPDGECVWGSPFMWVDSNGRRFTDETFLGVFGQIIRAERLKPGRYFSIFDSNFRENISRMPPEHFSLPVFEDYDFESLFASWVERGAEIERYNGYCEAGEDDDFDRDPKTLVPVNKPPYYAIMSVDEKPMVGTVTLNGLVIDDKQRVLDKRYNPIVGLYATGNNSDGRFAVQYSTQMQGLTLGFAMTHGRELGKALTSA